MKVTSGKEAVGSVGMRRSFVEILSGLAELEKRQTVLVRWENEAQRFFITLRKVGMALYEDKGENEFVTTVCFRVVMIIPF